VNTVTNNNSVPKVQRTSFASMVVINKNNKGEEKPSVAQMGEERFQTVKHNRRRTKVIVGSNNTAKSLPVAERMAWLHLWRLHEDVTPGEVLKYLNERVPGKKYVVEQQKAKGKYSSFKVGVPEEMRDGFLDANSWPNGAAVSRWFFRVLLKENSLT
jgi:hypothetical protein